MGFFDSTDGLFSDISCTMSNTSNCSVCKAYLSNKCKIEALEEVLKKLKKRSERNG